MIDGGRCVAQFDEKLTLLPVQRAIAGNELAVEGMRLFNKTWQPERDGGADGLGPLFNADSCRDCHPRGGSAGTEKNVQLISFLETDHVRAGDLAQLFETEGVAFQPRSRSFILPRQGTYDSYSLWRLKYLGLVSSDGDLERRSRQERAARRKYDGRSPVATLRTTAHHKVVLSERNTPALFGIGRLNEVSMATLRELEDRQRSQNDGVSGRIAPAANGQPGRFGWRGQIGTVEEFVAGACANELGLQTKAVKQLRDHYGGGMHPFEDIAVTEVAHLAEFVKLLPSPKSLQPADERQKNLIAFGEKLMHTVGCTTCHVPKLQDIDGVYSDLLLHDMGSSLADPVGAQPMTEVTGTATITGVSYSGSITRDIRQAVDTNVEQEWRTPPLWGIADSSPYLHDGRAAYLIDAIRWHDGEAASSRKRFFQLSRQDQQRLIGFLKTQRAPVL